MNELILKKDIAFSNSLIAGRYSLSKEEQNLIFLLASQINKDDEDFKDYKVTIENLNKATGTIHNRKRIKELQLSIMQKPIWLDKNKTRLCNWFSYIEALENESALLVRFDKALKPYLLQLKEFFTKAELSTLFIFKSKYSGRLYLLFKSEFDKQKQFKDKVAKKIAVLDLHNQFSMPKSYIDFYSKFKNMFLIKAVDEINEKTELNVSYKEIKTGRKITEIEFCISSKVKEEEKKEIEKNNFIESSRPTKLRSKIKPSNIKPLSRELLGLDPTENLNSNLRSLLSEFNRNHQDILINDCKFKERDIKAILKKYDVDSLIEICDTIYNKYEKIKNHQAFFRHQLKSLDEYF